MRIVGSTSVGVVNVGKGVKTNGSGLVSHVDGIIANCAFMN